jgi:hypothetical protein
VPGSHPSMPVGEHAADPFAGHGGQQWHPGKAGGSSPRYLPSDLPRRQPEKKQLIRWPTAHARPSLGDGIIPRLCTTVVAAGKKNFTLNKLECFKQAATSALHIISMG